MGQRGPVEMSIPTVKGKNPHMHHGIRIAAGAAIGIVLACPALAHVGQHQDWGLSSGILHPLLGWDHLLAMLALGMWAGLSRPPLARILLMAFPAGMVLGAMLALGGLALPGTEWGIGLSGLALGVLVWRQWSLPAGLSILMATGFGLCHGYAHGAEIPQTVSVIPYVAGFLGSTLLLHLTGFAAARLGLNGTHPRGLLRLSGLAVSLLSAGLLVAG